MASHSKKTSKPKLSRFKSQLFRRILANLLILFGVGLLFTIFALTQFSWISNSLAKSPPIPVQASQVEVPVFITVGQEVSKLPVIPGEISQGQWDLSNTQAVFLKTGGQINQFGNIVIYGHDTIPVFGKLSGVTKKDQIILATNSKNQYTYQIDQIKTVWPNDVSILNQPKNQKMLTLFTCSGLFDSQRLVITAHQI